MKSNYMLNPGLYKTEFESVLLIDGKKTIVPTGKILVFDKSMTLTDQDFQIDGAYIAYYLWKQNGLNDYYRAVRCLPTLSYVQQSFCTVCLCILLLLECVFVVVSFFFN